MNSNLQAVEAIEVEFIYEVPLENIQKLLLQSKSSFSW